MNERKERGVREDNSEGMSTEEAVEFCEKIKTVKTVGLNKVIELLKRGEGNN